MRLAGKTNAATGSVWTDAERTAEAQRLYPLAALHLLCGMVNHESLLILHHGPPPARVRTRARRASGRGRGGAVAAGAPRHSAWGARLAGL